MFASVAITGTHTGGTLTLDSLAPITLTGGAQTVALGTLTAKAWTGSSWPDAEGLIYNGSTWVPLTKIGAY